MSRAYLTEKFLSLVAAAALAAACGGDDDDDGADAPDSGTEVDAGAELDSGAEVDSGTGECVPTDQLPTSFRPLLEVSEGTVETTQNGDVTEAIIDARAGGFGSQAENPYVYIDLEKGTKVEIDDVEAFASSEWDVAFKRTSIRSNGGDSGTGGVEIAQVEAEALDDVTEAPPDTAFQSDDWVNEDCEYLGFPFTEEPFTAFGEWYDYAGKQMIVTPKPIVHVVRTRSGTLVKLDILTFYAGDGLESGLYGVEWAPLP